MLPVRNFKRVCVGLLFLLTLVGCEEKDPFVTPGKVENPNWVITVDNNMTVSMTALVQVSFAQNEGVLAAFMGEECCGIGEYIDGLYWLYITPATEDGGEVQLKFYSPDLKRIFVAEDTFPFRNNDMLGTVANPYSPSWVVAK